VPSAFALRRLEELGAPLGGRAHVIPSVQRGFAERSSAAAGEYALYAGRLTAEKGAADAIAACRLAGVPLVIAGAGPDAAELRAAAGVGPGDLAGSVPDDLAGSESEDVTGWARDDPIVPAREDHLVGPARPATPAALPPVRFTGRVDPSEVADLRAGAALALVPSRYEEILPLAALEAMAAGLPVVASRAGGLAEIVPEAGLHPPGDVQAMAERIRALWRDAAAGEAALATARERTAPPVVAAALRAVYDG
jgi:glycosyltransferase involved in cell wall biosynthesis